MLGKNLWRYFKYIDVLNYFTLISFCFSVFSAKVSNVVAFFAVLITLVFMMTNLIRSVNKKRCLIELLNNERFGTLKLLLAHEYMMNSSEFEFKRSKLKVSHAKYTFSIEPYIDNETMQESIQYGKLNCKYAFYLRKASEKKNLDFNVLVTQPRGHKVLNGFFYMDDKEKHFFDFKEIKNETIESNFKGYLKGKISPINTPLSELTVEYTLENSYRRTESGTILICPFLYADSVDTISIEMIYDIPTEQIISIGLSKIPYGGKSYLEEVIGNFDTLDRRIWRIDLDEKHTQTDGVYFINIKYADNI